MAALLWLADQTSKWWAERELVDRGRVDLLGDLFGLRLTYNPGAAFSTGTGYTWVFTILASVATVVVLVLARRLGSRVWALALGLLLAGITGNLTDRIFRAPSTFQGHVVDFLQLPNWPIFNIADVCLNVGVGLILLQTIRGVRMDGTLEKDHQAAEAEQKAGPADQGAADTVGSDD